MANNAADSATLTAAGFAATLPVTNLQLEGRTKVARTTSAANPVVISGTWSGGNSVAAMCLYRHNLTGSASWRLELFDGANQTGSTVYDSGLVAAMSATGWGEFAWGAAPWGQNNMTGWDAPFSVMWFTGVTAQSLRITINDAGNPAGYIQAKRLLLGAYFESAVNPALGMALSVRDSSAQRRTGAGGLRTENEATWRRLELALDSLSLGERASLMDLTRTVGLKREMFVSVFPTDTAALGRDYAMLCKFVGQVPSLVAVQPTRYSQSIALEEV